MKQWPDHLEGMNRNLGRMPGSLGDDSISSGVAVDVRGLLRRGDSDQDKSAEQSLVSNPYAKPLFRTRHQTNTLLSDVRRFT